MHVLNVLTELVKVSVKSNWPALPGIWSEDTWLAHWASWESPKRLAQRATTARTASGGTVLWPACVYRTTSSDSSLPSETRSRGIIRVWLSR